MASNPQVSVGEKKRKHRHTWLKTRQGHWVCTTSWCEEEAACLVCLNYRLPGTRDTYLVYCDIHHA